MMKKNILFICILALVSLSVVAKDIQYGDLPRSARKFLDKHFLELEATAFSYKDEVYTARFGKTAQVKFDDFGDWIEVISYQERGVPKAVIPKKIAKSINDEIKGDYYVVQIEKSVRGYIVNMQNGLELKFSPKFQMR